MKNNTNTFSTNHGDQTCCSMDQYKGRPLTWMNVLGDLNYHCQSEAGEARCGQRFQRPQIHFQLLMTAAGILL